MSAKKALQANQCFFLQKGNKKLSKWPDLLDRSCHSSGDPDTFYCPRCPRDTSPTFSSWKAAALHLWKEHRLDMELYSCDLCLDFRSYTLSRLQEHKAWHRVDRPFLCNKCGKGFKTGTQLKVHATRHKTDEPPLDEPLSATATNVFHRSVLNSLNIFVGANQ